MGFLDSSTNNIIIDAVLTNSGRQRLSRNDGSFSIVKFSPGDDEIDYSIIQKFGRTVGKEKIEKNTPILEALTNQNLAQKYKLVSVSDPDLIRLPTFSLTGEGVDNTNDIVSIGNTTNKQRDLVVRQDIQDEQSIDVELRDQGFMVDLSNLFLQVVGTAPDNVSSDQRAQYLLTRDASETSVGGSKVSFTIRTKAITNSQFQIYGNTNNKNIITTFVRITGINSSAVKEFEVQIQKNQ